VIDVPYEQQTVDHPNPIARFSHRARMRKSRRLVKPFLTGSARLLDYGCGQGRFLHDLAKEMKAAEPQVELLGYDPYQSAQFDGYRVVSDPTQIAPQSVDIVTILEVCEHLTDPETDEFLEFAASVMSPHAKLLVSVPIEIGPALLIKEPSRCILHRRRSDVKFSELLRAAFFGKPAQRAENVKLSHRGYDWRVTRRRFEQVFECEHLEFSPLPYRSWYGQSQAIMLFGKPDHRESATTGAEDLR
jgi:SAM-dependent methyltransferase